MFPITYNPNGAVVEHGHCFLSFPMYYTLYQVSLNFVAPLLCILIMNIMVYRVAKQQLIWLENRRKSFAKRKDKLKKTPSSFAKNLLPTNFKAAKVVENALPIFLLFKLFVIDFVYLANYLIGISMLTIKSVRAVNYYAIN